MKYGISLFVFIIFYSSIISGQSLKLMTYNIRLNTSSDGINAWPNRKDFVSSQIIFYRPDIFGIQEAMPEQVKDLDSLLSDYNHFGKAREGLNKGEASSIFFLKERFNVFSEGTFWLSETPDTISKGWDAACHRVCSYGLFFDKINKNFIWVFNTHLDHMGELARTNGLNLILSKINELNTNKYPVAFMGDLNSGPDTDRIKSLKSKMYDCRDITFSKPFGPYGTFNGFNFCAKSEELIDYIFLSDKIQYKVKKYAVLTDNFDLKYPSDHFPVYVELEYAK
jgi:endonuclease/exonuclease/phosphatase family metal-dependent hydrolase